MLCAYYKGIQQSVPKIGKIVRRLCRVQEFDQSGGSLSKKGIWEVRIPDINLRQLPITWLPTLRWVDDKLAISKSSFGR
jgi:hypothetical protein